MLHDRLFVVAILATLCWVVGCDTIHGVSRTVPLDAIPSAEGVQLAIRATPGVKDVRRDDVAPATGWSLYKGVVRDPGFAQFICHDDASAFAVVAPKETNEDDKQLSVYSLWINHVPTASELANARLLIDRICKSLHERLPSIPASSSSQDKFIGKARADGRMTNRYHAAFPAGVGQDASSAAYVPKLWC